MPTQVFTGDLEFPGGGLEVSVSWGDVTGKPTFATVATSGDYDDLSNLPTLGTAAAADTGDFATAAQGALAVTAVQPGDLATVATSGDYGDLLNTPSIPTVNYASISTISGDWKGTGASTLVAALTDLETRLAALEV